ncbi:hypothetical protein [Moorena sp. SIO3I6]|uniref:hypothetical protein n=1 Tax=Moorena sp. SIO3I6 TaxID=2607831 RepID=UPI0013F939BE|nr:hypothetical protein [Moorena sp. SIO3I6]NEP25290.1 hypothetical protein [Moorena sp. SIO3I6]
MGRWGAGEAALAPFDRAAYLLPTPYSLLPVPCSLFPVPCSLFPTPDSRLPTPDSRLPIPYSLFPTPDSRLPTPDSLKPKTKVPHPVYNGKIRHSTHGTNWFNSAQASVFGANRIPS